jgi:hypothetical protein
LFNRLTYFLQKRRGKVPKKIASLSDELLETLCAQHCQPEVAKGEQQARQRKMAVSSGRGETLAHHSYDSGREIATARRSRFQNYYL